MTLNFLWFTFGNDSTGIRILFAGGNNVILEKQLRYILTVGILATADET